jgi:Protein of unknown function (DUF2938)
LRFALCAIWVGVGATILMDVWTALLKHGFGIQTLNYAMVGRWIGHFRRGKFTHNSIAAASSVRGERVTGWLAHYAIGVFFAALLLAVWGPDWAHDPTLLPPLFVGIITVLVPFFVMQPAMGAGVAASKTPSPRTARLRSITTHAVFGLGLYISGLLWSLTVRSI